jgi:hypothetical protein
MMKNPLVWFILINLLILVTAVTPLLGSFQVKGSLQIMIGLFAAFFVASWIILICYPLFN